MTIPARATRDPQAPARLTSSDILRMMQVPGRPRLFVLSPFERPVNVMSQQLRAINLVHALLDTNYLCLTGEAVAVDPAMKRFCSVAPGERRKRIAVIGAGVAGTTAAAYAAFRGCDVTVFENTGKELQLFASSERYLHPVMYDWPDLAPSTRAAVPVMSWQGGVGSSVARSLLAQWEGWQLLYDISVHRHAVVSLVHGAAPGVFDRIPLHFRSPEHPAGQLAEFDAVLLAVGFGPERLPNDSALRAYLERFRYWTREPEPHWLTGDRVALISGTGDGGLTDLFWLAIQNFQESDLQEWVRHLPAEAFRRVVEIEVLVRVSRDAGITDISELITESYAAISTPMLNKKLKERIQPVQIIMNGSEANLLTDKCYPINRFIASRLLQIVQDTRRTPLDIVYHRGRLDCWKTEKGVFAHDTDAGIALHDKLNHGRPFSKAIVRWGPELSLKRSFPDVFGLCEKLRDGPQVGLTRRATWPAPYILIPGRSDAGRQPFEGVVRRHLSYSDFFDSTVQRQLHDAMVGPDGGPGAERRYRALYLGRLRLLALLHGKVLLTDAQVLDGEFFLGLSVEDLRALRRHLVFKFRRATVAESTLAFVRKNEELQPFEFSAIRRRDVRDAVSFALRAHATLKEPPKGSSGAEVLASVVGRSIERDASYSRLIDAWNRWHTMLPRADDISAARPIDFHGHMLDPGRFYADLKDGRQLFRDVLKKGAHSRSVAYQILTVGEPAEEGGDAWRIRSWYNAVYNTAIARKEGANVIETVWVDGGSVLGVDFDQDGAAPSRAGGLVTRLGLLTNAEFTELERRMRRLLIGYRRGQSSLDDVSAKLRALADKLSPLSRVVSSDARPSTWGDGLRRWQLLGDGLLSDDLSVSTTFVPANLDGDDSACLIVTHWAGSKPGHPLTISQYSRSLWQTDSRPTRDDTTLGK